MGKFFYMFLVVMAVEGLQLAQGSECRDLLKEHYKNEISEARAIGVLGIFPLYLPFSAPFATVSLLKAAKYKRAMTILKEVYEGREKFDKSKYLKKLYETLSPLFSKPITPSKFIILLKKMDSFGHGSNLCHRDLISGSWNEVLRWSKIKEKVLEYVNSYEEDKTLKTCDNPKVFPVLENTFKDACPVICQVCMDTQIGAQFDATAKAWKADTNTVIFSPCGHSLCENCESSWNKICPFCRKPIHKLKNSQL